MFSIVIPYYKKRKYIERCLDSVLSQTFKGFEIILVDDGSDDDLQLLIDEKYLGKVRLIVQENQGVSTARNAGIACAKMEYIAFLDADDCWSPFYLEKNAEIIHKETDVKIIGSHYTRDYSQLEVVLSQLRYYKFENYFKDALKNTYFTSSSSVIKKTFFEENLGFRSSLKKGEDIDVWLRTVASGGNVYYIKNTLVYYSDEDENQATQSKFGLHQSILSVMRQEYIKETNPIAFQNFAKIYMRKNMYPYFYDPDNHALAKSELSKIGYGNLFSKVLYSLPFSLGRKCIHNRLIRYYVKYLVK